MITARLIKVAEVDNLRGIPTVEQAAIVDGLSLMTQLGHVPAPGTRESW